ncbi:hypothetical protein DW322_05055 [Rhodococcus rhodnii]|uniref:MFS transporter n=2 Tax=Rhodococcus rhodnii TaxID=38312 RepID=A0A6P2CBJ2_9NOCA|nr:membrane protein [Rhodococcus rhodnii]TXG89702.1 hypothetical protein DW322_05055 [Rhodococcus rhodnii]
MRRATRTLRESPGLARLVTVRFAAQCGDGMFQAALGGAILFNPERQTEPAAIAAGFAVLLLPYSVVGPYAGALLDRWDRRLVLLWANALRAVLILATATALALGADEAPIMLLALTTVGVSRFVLSGVSASLPHVVRPGWLVATNSVLATVGSGFSAAGAASAVAVIGLVGAGDRGSAAAVTVAALGSVVAAVAAARFGPQALGPGPGAPRAPVVRTVLSGLVTGARTVWRAPGVTTAMIGIGAHRIVFGIDTLILVLVLREPTEAGGAGGLVGFGLAVSATALGMLAAAVTTPLVLLRVGRPRTVVAGLVVAFVVQVTLVPGFDDTRLLVAALLLGFAGQTIKLTGDAAMQLEIRDAARGRVFALQDTVFNIAFVAAVAVAGAVIAPDGRTPALAFGAGAVYLVGLVAVAANSRRRRATS